MPKALQGLLAVSMFLSLFFLPQVASAKGLRTEELGNTEKEEISQLTKKITDNPEDGPLVFASAQGLIKHHPIYTTSKSQILPKPVPTSTSQQMSGVSGRSNPGQANINSHLWKK